MGRCSYPAELVPVITCEHAGHRVPPRYRQLFTNAEHDLSSHRGYDPGALFLARELGKALSVQPIVTTTTRLLIDTNRSLSNRRLLSGYSRSLGARARQTVVEQYYLPHRRRVERAVAVADGAVIHLAVHSFTPVLDGKPWRTDLGLLYDPRRGSERNFCVALQQQLRELAPSLLVRRNHPYRGVDDGLTTALRRGRPHQRYLGIELELNQRHANGPRKARAEVVRLIVAAVRQLVVS